MNMYKYPRSAYIHIPFCHRRCFYCDFAVVPIGDNIDSLNGNKSDTVKDYLTYLKKEILSIKHKSPLSTIYIGGGTPSILDPTQIEDLINIFRKLYCDLLKKFLTNYICLNHLEVPMFIFLFAIEDVSIVIFQLFLLEMKLRILQKMVLK